MDQEPAGDLRGVDAPGGLVTGDQGRTYRGTGGGAQEGDGGATVGEGNETAVEAVRLTVDDGMWRPLTSGGGDVEWLMACSGASNVSTPCG